MTTSSFLGCRLPHRNPAPEPYCPQTIPVIFPQTRFPSHEPLVPSSARLLNPGRGFLLRSIESSSANPGQASSLAEEAGGGEEEEEDGLCPVDCVREFKTEEEFSRILEKGKETDSLVVVDFYRTSCGSCKYVEQAFAKLCKGSGGDEVSVVFLKHNVIDEYDEQSEVAERLRIKSVPLFQFYKDGILLESFPTRDKERILAAIRKYTSN